MATTGFLFRKTHLTCKLNVTGVKKICRIRIAPVLCAVLKSGETDLILKPEIRNGRSVVFAAVPAMLVYSVSLIVLSLSGFSAMDVLADPAQQTGVSSFIGFISNLGVWLWLAAAAIGFFTAFNLPEGDRKPYRELILLLAVLSLALAFDDLFLIHDRYIGQKYCYSFYAIFAVLILVRHFRRVLAIDGFAFFLSGTLLAASVFTDLVQGVLPLGYSVTQVFEEGFKFTGAAVWLYFCGSVARAALRQPTGNPPE